MNMRNATCVRTQTSKVPTRVTLLFIFYSVTERTAWNRAEIRSFRASIHTKTTKHHDPQFVRYCVNIKKDQNLHRVLQQAQGDLLQVKKDFRPRQCAKGRGVTPPKF